MIYIVQVNEDGVPVLYGWWHSYEQARWFGENQLRRPKVHGYKVLSVNRV